MTDDEFDALLKAHADDWAGSFTEPTMQPLEVAVRRHRAWIKPFAVATSLMAAAAVTVVVAVHQPAKPPMAGPADIGGATTSSVAPEPAITREIPQTTRLDGQNMKLVGTLDWSGAVADPQDPKAFWVTATEFNGFKANPCGDGAAIPVATVESGSTVTIEVAKYARVDSSGNCIMSEMPSDPSEALANHRVRVELQDPIGHRTVQDGSGTARAVLPDWALPQPTAPPGGYRGGDLVWNESAGSTDAMMARKYEFDYFAIAIEVRDQPKVLVDRKVTGHPEVNGYEAEYFTAPGAGTCISWADALQLSISVCSPVHRADQETLLAIANSIGPITPPAAFSADPTFPAPVPLPPTYDWNGQTLDLVDSATWYRGRGDDSDPNLLLVQAGTDKNVGTCSPLAVPFASETAERISVRVGMYLVPGSHDCSGTNELPPPQQVRVPLKSPLTGRDVIDGADGTVRSVISTADLPVPQYIPEGYAGGTLTSWRLPDTTSGAENSAYREWQGNDSELTLTLRVGGQETAGSDGTDPEIPESRRIADTTVNGTPAAFWTFFDVGNSLCLYWSAPREGALSLCTRGTNPLDQAALQQIADSMYPVLSDSPPTTDPGTTAVGPVTTAPEPTDPATTISRTEPPAVALPTTMYLTTETAPPPGISTTSSSGIVPNPPIPADHPNAVPTNIVGVEANPDDPNSIWILAGENGGDPGSWCSPQAFAFVTAETATSVTVSAISEGTGPEPRILACDRVAFGPIESRSPSAPRSVPGRSWKPAPTAGSPWYPAPTRSGGAVLYSWA